MSRPRPTPIYHFTHFRNLPRILEGGLCSDALCRSQDLTDWESGSRPIKDRRLTLDVGIPPGGTVGDYVPFYFAPRSPMMFTLGLGNHGFAGDIGELVYLETSLEELDRLGVSWIVSDRNAALRLAEFVGPDGDLDAHVDWPLMKQQQWGKTGDDPERPDRRMAECLARDRVPVAVFSRIVVKTEAVGDTVRQALSRAGHSTAVNVGPDWYF